MRTREQYESPSPEAFHDAWVSRGMTCAGTHALGEALCQNVTAVLADLAEARRGDEPYNTAVTAGLADLAGGDR